MKRVVLFFLLSLPVLSFGQSADTGLAPLITDVPHRSIFTLDGEWHYIVDQYETGYFNFRYKQTTSGFFLNQYQQHPGDLVEYNFATSPVLNVPGDWNTQNEKLFYYEGTIWYEKTFIYHPQTGKRVFLYFGAANYDAVVGLNGKILGEHIGGFTPFDFEVTHQLKDGENFVVVKVDNTRYLDGVPTNNFDWWNYGGLTRNVSLIETPSTFVEDYFIHLQDIDKGLIEGWVQLNGNRLQQPVTISIPALHKSVTVQTDEKGRADFSLEEKNLQLWWPENPKLYNIDIIHGNDTLQDEVGFRTIAVKGQNILLNGKSVFLRGVCIHEEAPFGGGRAYSAEQDHILLSWAKQMNCNFVRLAHYPHNEAMIREAEKIGILVWAEIPVYWTIQWDNPATFHNAKTQLTEEITRDKNRCNIILWSVGNETPDTHSRLLFMKGLANKARSLDSTRLITAALLSHTKGHTYILDDSLGKYLDVLGCNVYPGWYGPAPAADQKFETSYNKPMIMSEFGGAALQGFHGDTTERWTEEFQRKIYEDDIHMLEHIPFLRGTTAWVLKDFRSPKRLLPYFQDGWNRKGLISDQGIKKEAFFLMQDFYKKISGGSIKFGN